MPATSRAGDSQLPNMDILLNSFEIKKKRYRVLLHHDHIVWEQLRAQQQPQQRHDDTRREKSAKIGVETEELSLRAIYSSGSKVVSIDEIICTTTGDTKVASLQPPEFPATSSTTPPPQSCSPPPAIEPQSCPTAIEPQSCSLPTWPPPPTERYLTLHYGERIVRSPTDCNRWRVRTLTLFNGDPFVVHRWQKALSVALDRQRRVRRLLVFINPFGGRKNGLQTYDRYCKPLFRLAGIDASCIISQRANQIHDILLTHDLEPFDGVCCVGGDGTVAEAINGLIFRRMRDLGLDQRRPAYIPRAALPIGIIPAGSTDSIAYSVHGTSDARTAALHVLLSRRRRLDVCSVRNRQGLVRFCASVFSYGYLGDVAAKSEQYRWMGPKRYEYVGAKSFLKNRGYAANVRILLPLDGEQETRTSNGQAVTGDGLSICYANCQRCSVASSRSTAAENASVGEQHKVIADRAAPETGAALSAQNALALSSSSSALNHNNNNSSSNEAESENDEADDASLGKWKVLQGEFFMLSGANITCACSKSPNGIARYSHLGDGYLDLILVRKTSLLNNIRLLVNMMGRSGDIRILPFVETYRTRQFRFRAGASADSEEEYSVHGSCQPIAGSSADSRSDGDDVSSWNCDGEVVTDLDITMSSHCQLIDVFMRGPYAYKKPSSVDGPPSTLCCCTPNN